MTSSESGDSGDRPAYEKDLDKEAEDAAREIRQRAEREREAAQQHADDTAAAVHDAIKSQARKLAGEILMDSGAAPGESSEAAAKRPSKKRAGRKTGKKRSGKKRSRSGKQAAPDKSG